MHKADGIVRASKANRGRVFAYCHDSVGIGHLTRTLAICKRVGHEYPFSSFLIATGTPYVSLFGDSLQVDSIKLPALAKDNGRTYRSKFLSMSPDQVIRCRQAMLRDAIEHFDPEVMLVDKAPLGVCRELVPALRWLRQNRPQARIIFGMRDIEDSPQATIEQWERAGVPEFLEECFDEIWVYGTQSIFDVISEYRLSPRIAAKVRFMGYVVAAPCDHKANGGPDGSILVTVGGGTDGDFLLRAYLDDAAMRLSAGGWRSTVIGGPDLPGEQRDSLRRQASGISGVEWLDFDSCMGCRLRGADLVVSMGGYNTLCQIARERRPAVVVPRTRPRLEQAIRARLWAERGVIEAVDAEAMTPDHLAERIAGVLRSAPRVATDNLDLGGLNRIVERFENFWEMEPKRATPLCV